MKPTKNRLRRIIKEEIRQLNERRPLDFKVYHGAYFPKEEVRKILTWIIKKARSFVRDGDDIKTAVQKAYLSFKSEIQDDLTDISNDYLPKIKAFLEKEQKFDR